MSSSSHQQHRFERSSFAVVGLVAVLVYANTLIADFTFDDNFAVITNGDVTNAAIPTRDLFKHDFWGQDITSSQSHKSYRPLTILTFRLTHRAWALLTAAAPAIPGLIPRAPPAFGQAQEGDGRGDRPPGLHPFPFHVLCVALHAIASMLVLGLALHLTAVLEDGCHTCPCSPAGRTCSSSGSGSDSTGSSSSTGQPKGSLAWQQLWMWQQQPKLWRVPQGGRARAQALLAGLMFALHPVHTEAVAGVVGCAELLCAVLSCPAILCYFMAVDGRYAAAQQLQGTVSVNISSSTAGPEGGSQQGASKPHRAAGQARAQQRQQQHSRTPAAEAAVTGPGLLLAADALQHWLLVLAAAGLAFAAALSKEIGITVIGSMLVYDVLLSPTLWQPAGPVGVPGGSRLAQQRCRWQLLRMVLVAATAIAYVKFRQWVAVQQLVNIYRKVENPIPFAASRATRILSTGFLHVRYFWQLVMPLYLSADWSFDCIPLVEGWQDVRNVGTLALYCYFVYILWSARPFEVVRRLWTLVCLALSPQHSSGVLSPGGVAGGHTASSQPAAAAARGRWQLMVLVGLLIAPFFPASNILFYVGTFIGERLVYFPSIGFCLLVSELLVRLLPDAPLQHNPQPPEPQHASVVSHKASAPPAADTPPAATQQQREATGSQQQQQQPHAQQHPGASQQDSPSPAASTQASAAGTCDRVRSWAVVLLCAALLCCYASRTLLRNTEWWEDGRLFLSALRVCPNSAKVQQNCGVLQRRLKNYTAALEHFRRAQEIEPGYCEPTYWQGLTILNLGDPVRGIATMKASLPCRYTAPEALQSLNKVYMMIMSETGSSNPGPLLDWAAVLASPYVLRAADACATAEDAALAAGQTGKGVDFVNRAVGVCLQGLQHWDNGTVEADTLAALTKQRLTGRFNSSLLAECVKLRHPVYKKLAGNPPASRAVRRAVYKYILRVSQQQPSCRSLAGGGPTQLPEDGSNGSPTPSTHQKLVHKVQAADPEDPWLQLEWGLTLLALGASSSSSSNSRLQEASRHLEVSSALFNKAAQDAAAAAAVQGGRPGGKQQLTTALDGKTALTPLAALQAAVLPLETIVSANTQACDALMRLCHTKLQLAMLQRQQPDGGEPNEALVAARQCVGELSTRPNCAKQAAQLRKLAGGGPKE